MARKDKHGLTKAWRQFCDEYRTNGANATQAYLSAYPKSSTKAAEVSGHKLLRNSKVIEYIRERDAIAEAAADITQERIKRELGRVGFLDIRKLYDPQGNLIPVHELDDDTAAAISGIKNVRRFDGTDSDGKKQYVDTLEYRTVPKEGALRMLGQNKKMFTDKVALEGSGLVINISK